MCSEAWRGGDILVEVKYPASCVSGVMVGTSRRRRLTQYKAAANPAINTRMGTSTAGRTVATLLCPEPLLDTAEVLAVSLPVEGI